MRLNILENRIILVSHGDLSRGMKNSVNMIIGDTKNCVYFGLEPGQSNIELANKVENYILSNGDNVYIIIADLLGGSVSNAVSRLTNLSDVYLINGMNSGLVISLLLENNILNEQRIKEIINESKNNIGLQKLSDIDVMDESEIV